MDIKAVLTKKTITPQNAHLISLKDIKMYKPYSVSESPMECE